MHAAARTLLLLIVTVCLALPMAGGLGARGAGAAERPCPSKVVLKACVLDTSADMVAPRGTATIDTPCLGKAIGVPSFTLTAPAVCDALAFEVASASLSGWSPPTPARPPRS